MSTGLQRLLGSCFLQGVLEAGGGAEGGQMFGVCCWHGFKCEAYMLRNQSVRNISVTYVKCGEQDRLGRSVDAALSADGNRALRVVLEP